MSTTQNEIAENIRQQLGHKALFMLGAKNLIATGSGLAFKIRGSEKANAIKVNLDAASDTYTVTFYKARGIEWKTVAEHDGIYVDGLHRLIESETGLYTSMGTMGR